MPKGYEIYKAQEGGTIKFLPDTGKTTTFAPNLPGRRYTDTLGGGGSKSTTPAGEDPVLTAILQKENLTETEQQENHTPQHVRRSEDWERGRVDDEV